MRKHLARSVVVCAVVTVIVAALAAGTALARPANTVTKATDVVLTLTPKSGPALTYTLDQIRAMNTAEQGYYEGYAGFLNSASKLEPIHPVRGVRLTSLLKLAGYDPAVDTTDVKVLAIDGYPKLLSPDAVTGKGLITYTDVPPYPIVPESTVQFTAVLVYDYKPAGQKVDDTNQWNPELPAPDGEGPLRLWFATDTDLGYVVDGDWIVKWVNHIQVTETQVKQWSFTIKGPKKTSVITRKDFESCTAPSCHKQTTVKYKGHSYSGLPLYYMVGKVDDNKDMNNWGDFNVKLAKKGYSIQFVNAKNKKVSISSKLLVNRPRNIILAWKKDGKELAGSASPLWLQGPVSKITAAQRLSGLARMNLRNVPK